MFRMGDSSERTKIHFYENGSAEIIIGNYTAFTKGTDTDFQMEWQENSIISDEVFPEYEIITAFGRLYLQIGDEKYHFLRKTEGNISFDFY